MCVRVCCYSRSVERSRDPAWKSGRREGDIPDQCGSVSPCQEPGAARSRGCGHGPAPLRTCVSRSSRTASSTDEKTGGPTASTDHDDSMVLLDVSTSRRLIFNRQASLDMYLRWSVLETAAVSRTFYFSERIIHLSWTCWKYKNNK